MKESWTYKKLGEVCEVLDSKRKPVTKSKRISGIYPYYGATGIQDYVDKFIFDGNYLLVGEDGAKWGTNDKTAYQIHGKCWVNNHAHILKVNDDVANTSFLEYYLVWKDLRPFITGAIVQKLTQAALVSIPIPIPPLATQSRIVSELDLLQSIIDKQKVQLKEFDTLAQSIFYDMFGDPVENEKGWEVKRLGEVCSIGSSRRIFAEEYVDEGVPFYRSKEIIELSKGVPISVELFISEKRYLDIKRNNGIPSVGDLLITAVGTIGEIWIVDTDKPFYFKDGNIVWLSQINSSVSSLFFQFSLHKLIDEYKKKMAIGSAYNALTIVNLKKLNIIVPPLPLQQSFAQKIEAIERQKELINQSIREAQTLFDSRMEYYFGE